MKFVRLNFIGGTGDMAYVNILIRAEKILRYIAERILSADQGWDLDPRTSSVTTFVYYNVIKSSGDVYDTKFPGILFRNSISNCKMFIGLNSSNYGIYLTGDQLCNYESLTYPCSTSILVSIIPGESNEEFGDITGEFIPPSGTKIIGTNLSTDTSHYAHYIRANTSGTNYSYGFFVDPYWIGIAGGYSSTETPTLKLGVLCGRIFDNLFHSETLPQARYGCLKLTENTTGNNSEFSSYIKRNYQLNSNETTEFFGTPYSLSSTFSNIQYNYGMCFSKTGTPLFGDNNPGKQQMFVTVYGCHQLAKCYTEQDNPNITRWCPYMVSISSKDLVTNGVVPGDGIKSFIDTNILRACINNYGQLYNNSEFIGLGEGLIIKWNPESQDSI